MRRQARRTCTGVTLEAVRSTSLCRAVAVSSCRREGRGGGGGVSQGVRPSWGPGGQGHCPRPRRVSHSDSPRLGHLLSGLGWVTGDCLGGPAHGRWGSPQSPQPHLGLPPQPVPLLPRPPPSPSSSLPGLLPLYLGAAALLGPRLAASPGSPVSWMPLSPCCPGVSLCLSVSVPQPGPTPPLSCYLLPLTSGSPSSLASWGP